MTIVEKHPSATMRSMYIPTTSANVVFKNLVRESLSRHPSADLVLTLKVFFY